MQLIILHHHHSDPLFHPLQLFLKSSTHRNEKYTNWQKSKRELKIWNKCTFACEYTLQNLTSASRCWMYSDWLWIIGTKSWKPGKSDLPSCCTEERPVTITIETQQNGKQNIYIMEKPEWFSTFIYYPCLKDNYVIGFSCAYCIWMFSCILYLGWRLFLWRGESGGNFSALLQ